MLLHQLNIFINVAEEKSFSKAADAIYLSQSTISSHISNLEKYFGQKLFDRMGKEVILTHAGEKLFPIAKEMLALQDHAVQALIESTWKIEGQIRIAASSVPAQYIVQKFISQFNKKFPNIKFSLSLLDSRHVAEQLVRGEADVGILGHPYFTEQLEYIPIMKEKLVAITPLNIKFLDGFSVQDLAKYPVLFRKHGSGTQVSVEKILKEANVDLSTLNIVGYFDSVQVIKQCVKEGMGVSIISEIAAEDDTNLHLINTYELLDSTENRTFFLSYKTARTLSPAMDKFIKSFSPIGNVPL